MSNQVYYLKGNTYVDGDGKPALIKKGNQLVVTDDFKGGGGEPYVPPVYSTEEVDTGEKWIDGKNIYRKCVVVEELPNSDSVSLGVLAIENLVKLYGSCKSKNQAGYYRPMPLASGGTNDIRLDISNNELTIVTYGSWNSYEGIVIVEYTKPTPVTSTRKTSKKKG